MSLKDVWMRYAYISSHCINNKVSMATRKHKSFYTRPTHPVALSGGKSQLRIFCFNGIIGIYGNIPTFPAPPSHYYWVKFQTGFKIIFTFIHSYGFAILCEVKSFHLILNDAVAEYWFYLLSRNHTSSFQFYGCTFLPMKIICTYLKKKTMFFILNQVFNNLKYIIGVNQ